MTVKAEKKLIVKLGNDKELRVVVPAESKVTFGPAIPGPTRAFDGGVSRMEYALRVYNGATEKSGLLAVFTSVREFREDSIKVQKLVVREHGKTLWSSDEDGFEVSQSVKKERKLLPDSLE